MLLWPSGSGADISHKGLSCRSVASQPCVTFGYLGSSLPLVGIPSSSQQQPHWEAEKSEAERHQEQDRGGQGSPPGKLVSSLAAWLEEEREVPLLGVVSVSLSQPQRPCLEL